MSGAQYHEIFDLLEFQGILQPQSTQTIINSRFWQGNEAGVSSSKTPQARNTRKFEILLRWAQEKT